MANLSNINGKFVVEQTTGYVGVGTTDPSYPIEVLNASAAEIALNASGGSIYRLRSDNTDSFRINKNGVGDRLVIDGSGNSTFSGTIQTTGANLFYLGKGVYTKATNASNDVDATNIWGYGLYEGAAILGELSTIRDGTVTLNLGTTYTTGKVVIRTDNKVTALTIDSSQNSTFAGTVLIDGVSNYTGLTVKGSGASRPQIKFSNVNQGVLGQIYGTEANALVTTTIAGLEYQVRNANGTSGDHVFKSYNTAILTLDGATNAATFAGNVTAPSVASTDTSGRYFMIQNAAGNQTYPVYSFRTDGNTGMMNPGADILSLVTGGTTRLTINNSSSTFAGSVIGTLARFDTLNNNANSANIIYRSGTNTIVGNNASALVVQDGGSVGIGTTSPSQKLDVQGNVNINGTVVEEGSGNNKTFRYRTPNSNSHSGGNALITFGRFYWTPAHWVNIGPVLEVTLQCKYYSGYQRKYIIKAGYGDNEVIVNELQPSETLQRITLQVGTKTAAGYNYAGQPVYYVDLQWTQTAYIWGWAQLSQQVPFLTANPTSGWGGVVVYSALSQNNNAGTPQNYGSFFAGDFSIGTDNSSASAGAGVKITTATNNESLRVVSGNFTNGAEGLLMYSTSAGAFRFYVDWAGGIHATNTSIIAISDVTLKENIKPLETGLDEVMKLQPRRFDWKNGDGKNIAGFVAQEVEEILPDLIGDYKYTDKETKKSLAMGNMIPTLVKAIQELKAEIEILKNK